MSVSHHSIYSKHIRHQLSGTSALWEPGAPPQIPTPALWKPVSPPASQTLFNWFVELFITCTELEPAPHLNVLKKEKWYSHLFGVTTLTRVCPFSHVFPLCPATIDLYTKSHRLDCEQEKLLLFLQGFFWCHPPVTEVTGLLLACKSFVGEGEGSRCGDKNQRQTQQPATWTGLFLSVC